MKGTALAGQWIVAAASGLGILGLSYADKWPFSVALATAPVIMGLSCWVARSAPKALAALILGGFCCLLAAAAPPTVFFSVSAVVSGFVLPAFLARRPGEDDCYFLIPVLFVAVLAALFTVDRTVRSQGAWAQFNSALRRQIAEVQSLQESVVADMPLLGEDAASWREANRLLPYRSTGVAVAALGILFYAATAVIRRWVAPVRLMKNRFIHFRIKEIYLGFLIAGLAARALWILKPWPVLGHLAYGLLFFSGTGLLLEAISLAVFFTCGAERRGSGFLVGCALALALVAAPILALPCAAVGLVDVWLDFRKLDRILGEVRE